MATPEDRAVLAAAVRLIERTREAVPSYAGERTTGTMHMARLFSATGTRLQERRLPAGVKGMAIPYREGHLIVVDPFCQTSDRIFTVRHEFAHILAGEVEEALFLTSEDTMSFSERRADLYAVADLTQTWWMRWVRKGPRPWKAVTLDVVLAYRELTEGWTEARLWDRARLRVALFREHGI